MANHLGCVALLVLASCGAVPYSDEPYTDLDARTEYRVDPRPDGFTLYVWYGKFQFIGNRPRVAAEGREKLNAIAKSEARSRGKELRPIEDDDVLSNVGRNFWSVTSWSAKADCRYMGAQR